MASEKDLSPLLEPLSTSHLFEDPSPSPTSSSTTPDHLEITQQTLVGTEEMAEFNNALLEDSENTLVIEDSTEPASTPSETTPQVMSSFKKPEGKGSTSAKRN